MRSLWTIAIVLSAASLSHGQWQRSERTIEVPQPPVRVRQYIPQDVDVPQPPIRYKEITETRTYTVPLDEPKVAYSAPVVRYAAPVYIAPAVYLTAKYPVAKDSYGMFGLRSKVYYSDGSSKRSFGR